jgi:hypothetical protein
MGLCKASRPQILLVLDDEDEKDWETELLCQVSDGFECLFDAG